MAQFDPEFLRQIAAAPADSTVEAVVRLKPAGDDAAAGPDETERLTHELVSRAQRRSGQHEDAVNVFRYLGSFAVAAKPAFLKVLMDQPEVAAVVANRQPGSGMIPPVRKRPATLDEVGRKRPAAPKRRPPKARRAR